MSNAIKLTVVALVTTCLFAVRPCAAGAGRSYSPRPHAAVVLTVAGMQCEACQAAVRTALRDAKGVQNVEVDLAKKEAVVSYDPKETNPHKLVAVVQKTKGMSHYRASIKPQKTKG